MNSALDRAWEKKQEAKQLARAFLCAFRAGRVVVSRPPHRALARRAKAAPGGAA